MPITFRSGVSTGAGSTTFVTQSGSIPGNTAVVIVGVHDASTADQITGVTISEGGTTASMTSVVTQNNEYQAGRQLRTYGYYLNNTFWSTSLLSSITVTFSAAMTAIYLAVLSYDGINSTISTGRTGGATGNSTTHGVSVTVDGSSSIIISAVTKKDSRLGPFAAGSSTTERVDSTAGTGGPANQVHFWVGDQAAPTTGAHVSSATSSGAENWSMIGFELRESTTVEGPFTPVPELRLLGVGT